MYLSTLSLSKKAKYKSQVHSICTCTYCTGTDPMSGSNGRKSARKLAKSFNVSRTTMLRVFKDD